MKFEEAQRLSKGAYAYEPAGLRDPDNPENGGGGVENPMRADPGTAENE